MSSILKVDQLQDSGGNAIITSDGAGNLTAGTIPAKTIGTGAVLQVVQGTYSTQTDSTSGSAVATGLSVNITPQFSNSKIFVSYSLPLRNGVSSNNFILSYLYRDGSSIALTGILKADSSGVNGHVTAEILDTPATTSQVTYAAYVDPRGYTTQWCGAGTRATITAMEIAG